MKLPARPYWLMRAMSPQSRATAVASAERRKTTFPSFGTLFDVSDPKPLAERSEAEIARSLAELKRTAAVVIDKQKGYQPIYGIGSKSPRENLLRSDCKIVEDEFAHVRHKSQVRILDVGCNAGFVSFVLAETFPMTLGFDLNPPNVALCQAIRAHTGSSARFFNYNVLDVIETGEADLENLDCVLLLNVVHELIFAKGLPYVKAFIARLAQSVDFIVVELANRAEYIEAGKGHLLPVEPVEVLEACTDSTITLARVGKRPLYTIRRRKLEVGGHQSIFSERRFSNQPIGRNSRKYYFGANTFTKVIRFSSTQRDAKYTAELHGLHSLEGLNVAPRALGWDNDGQIGRICMERVYGVALPGALRLFDPAARRGAVLEILRISAALAQAAIRQSDFSAHNMVIQSDGSLRMFDFEFAGDTYFRDPFGCFLWLVNDVMKGQLESYERLKPDHLVLQHHQRNAKGARVDAVHYPQLEAELLAPLGPELAAIVAEALSTDRDWADYAQDAWARASRLAVPHATGEQPT
jgi:SAM-dependent methyltransferase